MVIKWLEQVGGWRLSGKKVQAACQQLVGSLNCTAVVFLFDPASLRRIAILN